MMLEIVGLALAGLFGGAIAAVAYGFLRDYSLMRRIAALEANYDSINGTIKGIKSGAARAEMSQETQAAMAEAMLIMNDKSITDKGAALMQIAGKYPSVVQAIMSGRLKL